MSKITGNFVSRVVEINSKIDPAISDALKEIGDDIAEEARNTTKFKVGNLASAINFFPTSQNTGYVIADKFYASWLEYGNNPGGDGRIRPINASALRFFINGTVVFAKSVKSHEPYNFMSDAVDKVSPTIPAIVAKHLDKV